MNNKGFAVSSVLYAILISFLLFLGVALAMFSSANNIALAANDDLVNGTGFTARRVIFDTACDNNNNWNPNNRMIKISSRYGTIYWPNDFTYNNNSSCYDNKICAKGDPITTLGSSTTYDSLKKYIDYGTSKTITFTDKINDMTTTVDFYNVCQ